MFKRAAIIVLSLLTLGCASTGATRTRECPGIVVENLNYNRVTIYSVDGIRLFAVDGFQTVSRRSCKVLNRPEEFRVVGFANSFSLSLRGHSSYLQPHETVYIQVGTSPNLSYIGRR